MSVVLTCPTTVSTAGVRRVQWCLLTFEVTPPAFFPKTVHCERLDVCAHVCVARYLYFLLSSHRLGSCSVAGSRDSLGFVTDPTVCCLPGSGQESPCSLNVLMKVRLLLEPAVVMCVLCGEGAWAPLRQGPQRLPQHAAETAWGCARALARRSAGPDPAPRGLCSQ